MGEDRMISQEEKDKIKEEIVTKVNSILEKNNQEESFIFAFEESQQFLLCFRKSQLFLITDKPELKPL